MDQPLLTERHENILQITLNRPDAYNALNLEMMTRLSAALASAAVDDSIRGVLLTGK